MGPVLLSALGGFAVSWAAIGALWLFAVGLFFTIPLRADATAAIGSGEAFRPFRQKNSTKYEEVFNRLQGVLRKTGTN